MTFGLDWIIWATPGLNPGTSIIKMNKSGVTYLNATQVTRNIVELKVYKDILANNSIIYVKSIPANFYF